mmetsp:Transcript_3825/g.7173  ORF Transcript_3825/g.7173 Transcript_3825/m.7173 type:complete len:82 (+) Transcript_3825:1459-1704(+)
MLLDLNLALSGCSGWFGSVSEPVRKHRCEQSTSTKGRQLQTRSSLKKAWCCEVIEARLVGVWHKIAGTGPRLAYYCWVFVR